MQTLASSIRPLTETEKGTMREKIAALDGDIRRGSRSLIPVIVVIAALWLLTLAASDTPWTIVTIFWFGAGAIILEWVRRDMKKHTAVLSELRNGIESAIRHDKAEVFDIQARAFATFEEVEDEGACYAFEIEDSDGPKVVFIQGQEYYEDTKFPSLDFSLVHPLDEEGHAVDMLIEKRGPKASPLRVIPASEKLNHDLPEHLEVVLGNLESVIGKQ